jgi:hypothetical protein
MKKIVLLIGILTAITCQLAAQTKLNIGGGYFGETATYPGVMGEFEYEKFHTERFSIPLKVNIGFYSHERNHNAFFIDIHEGLRRYFKEGKWYFEQSVGLGVMFSFHNEDLWHVDDGGGGGSGVQFCQSRLHAVYDIWFWI